MNLLKNRLREFIRFVLPLCLIFFITSCSNLDDTTYEEENEGALLTDAWICDMQSFEEDQWYYELNINDEGDYVAVSRDRILKVNKDGILNSIILIDYQDDDRDIIRLQNGKIYRFHYDNDFQNFDASQPIKLQIYDFDLILLSEHTLDTNGIPYDVEIENDNTFGMLVYNVDESRMTLKKISLEAGLLAQQVLSTSGTSPTNLHILQTGNYFCTASSTRNNLFLLDNNLDILYENELGDYTIGDAKYVPGKGIYVMGSVASFADPDSPSYVALIDMNGDEVSSYRFTPSDRWTLLMQVNDDRVCVVEAEPESLMNMRLTFLDFDLNVETAHEISGRAVASKIEVNENGSFSFIYGEAQDPNGDPFVSPYHTRIFKFDKTYSVPTNVIVQ